MADETARDWGVDVNEAQLTLYGSCETREWWELFRLRFKETPRVATASVGFPGDRIRIACADRSHAEYFHDLMISHGVPKAALKIGATSA